MASTDQMNELLGIYHDMGARQGTGVSFNEFVQQRSSGGASDNSTGSQSVRRRGSSQQQRVGLDTRVRGDESSGTGGAAGASIGAAMSDAAGATPATQSASSQNPLWKGARQPTDLASIQQRVLQSFATPK